MATDSFLLRVITPGGLQVEEQVQSVSLPSSRGEIGVLPGHVNYTTLLGIGVLEYLPILTDRVKKIVISGGFCSFREQTLVVLADSVDTRESARLDECKKKKEELEQSLPNLSGYEPIWEETAHEVQRLESLEQILK